MRVSLLAAAVGTALLASATAALAKVPQQECRFQSMDFSGLSHVDYSLADPLSNGVFHFSVCGPLTSVPACKGLSACVVNATGAYNWGSTDYDFSWYEAIGDKSSGVKYTVTGQNDRSGYTLESSVSFHCAAQQGKWEWDANGNGVDFKYVRLATPLACAPKPIAPPKPTREHQCTFHGVDYSSLSSTELSAPLPGDASSEFSLRVCGLVDSDLCAAEGGDAPWTTSACITETTAGWGSEAASVGDDVLAPAFSYVDPTHPAAGVTYTLNSGLACNNVNSQQPTYSTIVTLQCGQVAAPQLQLTTRPCVLLANVTTPLACTSEQLPVQPRHHNNHRRTRNHGGH